MIINEIFNDIPYRIFERGEQYYYAGRILSLDYDDVRNIVRSKVEESRFRQYTVEVKLYNDEVVGYYCNCPFAHGDICKHIVAVLLAINNGDHLKSLRNRPRLRSETPYSYKNHENIGIDDGIDLRSNHFDVDEGITPRLGHLHSRDDFSSRRNSFGPDDGFDSRRSSFGRDDGFDSRRSSFGRDDGFDSRRSGFGRDDGFDSRRSSFGAGRDRFGSNLDDSDIYEDFNSNLNYVDNERDINSRGNSFGPDYGVSSRSNRFGVDRDRFGSNLDGSDIYEDFNSNLNHVDNDNDFSSRSNRFGNNDRFGRDDGFGPDDRFGRDDGFDTGGGFDRDDRFALDSNLGNDDGFRQDGGFNPNVNSFNGIDYSDSKSNNFSVDDGFGRGDGFNSQVNRFGFEGQGVEEDFDSRSNLFDVGESYDSGLNSFDVDRDIDPRLDGVDRGFNSRLDGVDRGFNSSLDGVDRGFDSRLDGVDRGFDSRLDGVDRGFDPRLADIGRSFDPRLDGVDRDIDPRLADVGRDFNPRLDNINIDRPMINDSRIVDDDHFKMLESSSKDELIDFILEFSNRDKQLGYELAKRFDVSNSFDIGEIKRFINNSIKNDYHGDYLNDDDSYYIANELEEILDRYDKLLDKSTCNNIFKNTFEILIETSIILDRNIDEGIFTDFRNIIPHAEGLLHTAALYLERYGTPEDKNNAFFNLIKRGVYEDFKYMSNIYFFEIASIFVEEHNKEHFFRCFNKFQELHRDSYELSPHNIQSIERDILKRLEGDDVAYEYMINNIHIDSFAINVINQAFEEGNYKLAQKICLSKIKTIYKEFPEYKYNNLLKMWYKILHSLYHLSKERDAQRNLEVLYESLASGESKGYNTLKDVYTREGLWDEKHADVLDFIGKNLPLNDYMSILAKEHEWGLLFEEVKSHPDNIAIYGKDLAKVCPDKTFKLYTDEIIAESTIAYNRVMYRQVCDLIKNMYEDGGRESTIDIIHYLRETYKERPAFQDEINKLEGSLPDFKQFA